MNINSSRSDNKFTDSENKGSAIMSDHTFDGTQSVLSAYKGKTTGNKVGGGYWEPRDAVKGDIARILMYLYMHYSKEVSANSSFTYAGNLSITNIAYSSKGGASAVWDMLVDWHNNDEVDPFEANRNNYCASITGVRNPFIDNASYANAIWGNGTVTNPDSGSSGSGSTDSGTTTPDTGGSSSGSTGGTTVTTTKTVYRQLKSANGITVGSKIIIAAKDYDKALNKNQKDKARGYTTISKTTSGSDTYLTPSSSTEIIEVKSGNSTDGYTLYTSSGYLASASNDEDKLQTKSSLGSGKNAYWKINFSSGAANIVAQGSYTRNNLKYDSSNSEFSCYASGNTKKDVAIFKQYEETYTEFIPNPDTGSGTTTPSYEYPEANSLLTISKANEVANAAGTAHTTDKYKIQGTIESIANTTYGNMTIKDNSGNSIYIYGVYNTDGTVRYDALDELHKPQVGDTVTLSGVLGLYGSTTQMKNSWLIDLTKGEESKTAIQTLLNKYISTGKYTKNSVINFNDEAKNELVRYFHSGINELERTTYYNGNALWMTNSSGTINSGYGTDANGNMTHFKLNSDGTQDIDYTVNVSGGMEGFYVTPNDFVANNYYSSNWKYQYNVGYVYDLSNGYSSGEAKSYLEDFIDVAAPLLLDEIYTSNYVTLDKLVIKEVNNTLKLQIIVNSVSSGTLGTLVSDNLVLAESTITSGCPYSFS